MRDGFTPWRRITVSPRIIGAFFMYLSVKKDRQRDEANISYYYTCRHNFC
jgi:hypothetical protein